MIAVTTGDPAGIGPEISVRFAADPESESAVFIGDRDWLNRTARQLELHVEFIEDPTVQRHPGQRLCEHIPLNRSPISGMVDPANAEYVLNTLAAAADGCLSGRYHAMVTAPIHKGVINDAGIKFQGHTEFLAERTGTSRVVMMLACSRLRVALATTHLPLRDVPAAITPELLEQILLILDKDLQIKFGLLKPKIVVCGLNPHAGEGGHLGHEDDEIIAPVIRKLQQNGMNLAGPLPADTAFTPRHLDNAAAVLAMYHDQGLPVLKYAGFGDAVNITLGLPIIRTSVDHGTALDIAGRNRADHGSLISAYLAAKQIVACSRKLT